MSGEDRELHHYDHFLRDRGGFQLGDDLLSLFGQRPGDQHGLPQPPATADVSFTDFLHGSADYGSFARAFELSYAPPDLFGPRDEEKAMSELIVETNSNANMAASAGGRGRRGGGTTPLTPNSSVSSSSTEAAGEEDSERCKKEQQQEEQQKEKGTGEDGADKSKKV